jgi:hypothetical protein
VNTSPSGRSVVSNMQWRGTRTIMRMVLHRRHTCAVVLHMLVVVRSSDGRAGVGSVVRRAVVVVRGSSKATSSDRDSAEFSVASGFLVLVALPELHAGAFGVAVGWAGTVALLFLVMAREEYLEGCGNEEEEASGAVSMVVREEVGM